MELVPFLTETRTETDEVVSPDADVDNDKTSANVSSSSTEEDIEASGSEVLPPSTMLPKRVRSCSENTDFGDQVVLMLKESGFTEQEFDNAHDRDREVL